MKYLTKREVAEVLRVSVRTISTYQKRGYIPFPKKVGGILLWNEEELCRKIAYSSGDTITSETVKRGRPRKVLFS